MTRFLLLIIGGIVDVRFYKKYDTELLIVFSYLDLWNCSNCCSADCQWREVLQYNEVLVPFANWLLLGRLQSEMSRIVEKFENNLSIEQELKNNSKEKD